MKSKVIIMGCSLLTLLNITPSYAQSGSLSGGSSSAGGLAGGGAYSISPGGYISFAGDRRNGFEPPLVVRFSDSSASEQGTLEEDLSVMSVLLNKALEKIGSAEQTRSPYKMGIPIIFNSGTRLNQNYYIEGYGAFFVINVGFPLLPATSPKPASPSTNANNEWEAARRQLQGKEEMPRGYSVMESSSVPYNAESVEIFKKELIRSLKNAANIRGLKAEDFVSVTVLGPEAVNAAADGDSAGSSSENAPGEKPETILRQPGMGRVAVAEQKSSMKGSPGKSSVLSIKASKKAIDLFAAGKTSLEDFTKSVQVTTYFAAKSSQHASMTTYGGPVSMHASPK